MLSILSYIGKELNKNNIIWAVGASILLNQYGMVDKPNDIDILIDIKDIEKADAILKSLGKKKNWERAANFSTKYFYEYVVDTVEVDVMAGLAINRTKGTFEYHFDKESISEYIEVEGVNIPFTSMEDWYVLYQLIPKRQAKVDMIEKYLLDNGVKKRRLLKRSLGGNLPINVEKKILKLLKD